MDSRRSRPRLRISDLEFVLVAVFCPVYAVIWTLGAISLWWRRLRGKCDWCDARPADPGDPMQHHFGCVTRDVLLARQSG